MCWKRQIFLFVDLTKRKFYVMIRLRGRERG
nr:MAG TPA: hypothetical protein [Caudoviricetes sp.]